MPELHVPQSADNIRRGQGLSLARLTVSACHWGDAENEGTRSLAYRRTGLAGDDGIARLGWNLGGKEKKLKKNQF